uniref:WRKY domain-containing protein n=1 Tax=Triticum urartu TaxID=4572 RepID=A0A8R7P843_TRIUA
MPAPEEGDEDGLADHGSCRSAKKEQEKKGKGEKKARGSRVAFATKSEVDHLDDGYRWRKYGQKAVKNSSFPRSYYRCTAAQCGVKKLVERSQQDPSTVVTTYEGRHGHPSPIIAHHGARMLMATSADTAYSLAALQHHQHGFFPTGTDVYTSSVAHRVSEYGGIQFHDDLLPDATMGYQQGYR